MKHILIALLTFTLGVTAFYLLRTKQAVTSVTFTLQPKALEIPKTEFKVVPTEKTEVKNVPTEKLENLEPFFNSFSKDEFFSGWFSANEFIGRKLKRMPEVWTIELSRDSENPQNKLVWTAWILTRNADYSPNDDDSFHSVWIKAENNKLSFRTNKIRDIEYKFDGKFFKTGKNFKEHKKVLSGTLQKWVKGKNVAELTADFAYYEPHCFH